MRTIQSIGAALLALSVGGCDPFGGIGGGGGADGLSVFTITGKAFFTGRTTAPIKLGMFYSGNPLGLKLEATLMSGDIAVLQSNVTSLGVMPNVSTPFTMNVDLSAHTIDGDNADMAFWADRNNNNVLDVGEQFSLAIPNVMTGCPVYGSDSGTPINYGYSASKGTGVFGSGGGAFGDLSKGWNQYKSGPYVPAASGVNANIQSFTDFTLLP